MSRIGLGFDTGGTYTDAVIMDLDDNSILARSKSLTTRNDLSIGIAGAIAGFDRGLLSEVTTVSLSSTLATNSVVEGRGCRVGLICIGRDLTTPVSVDHRITVTGRFMPNGDLWEPLDEDAARSFLESMRGKVDSIAVNGYMSIRNPSQELRVSEMAREILGVPTVCGHELSSALGFDERAVTCVLNARLIPVIEELLESVNSVLDEFGIDAPLMIVKGDGSVMEQGMARSRPVETILSGPASSINGAMRLSDREDAVVVDIGGTTTDIGVLRGGRIRLDPEGAVIGDYRTRVMAAEITTAGIGGDSRITVNGNRLTMTSNRVIPLCVASSQHPSLYQRLRDVADRKSVKIRAVRDASNLVHDIEFFVAVNQPSDSMYMSDEDRRFMEILSDGPRSLQEAAMATGISAPMFGIRRLEDLGLIQRIGMTPTDIMHIRGSFTQYDCKASECGAEYYAKILGTDIDGFVEMTDALIADRISWEITRRIMYEQFEGMPMDGFGSGLVRMSLDREDGKDFSVSIRLNKPILGLGGPAYDMLPRVAEKLGTELITPPNYDVGNAVGAVTGKVVEIIDMLVRPAYGESLEEGDPCIVFSRLGREFYNTFEEGMMLAEEAGRRFVTDTAMAAGAESVEISVDRRISELPSRSGARLIEEAVLIIRATGDPIHVRPGS